MPCYDAKVTSKGQITIPVEIRRLFNLQEGDRVDFYAETGSSTVRIMARNGRLSDLAGLLDVAEEAVPSQREINDDIARHLVEDDERIKASWNEWQEFEAWRALRRLKAAE